MLSYFEYFKSPLILEQRFYYRAFLKRNFIYFCNFENLHQTIFCEQKNTVKVQNGNQVTNEVWKGSQTYEELHPQMKKQFGLFPICFDCTILSNITLFGTTNFSQIIKIKYMLMERLFSVHTNNGIPLSILSFV